jgi:hypothetical protein
LFCRKQKASVSQCPQMKKVDTRTKTKQKTKH